MRICYILVLKLVDLEAPLIENISDINPKSQEKVWEIKKIIDLGLIDNNKQKYFVKWKNYLYSNNTWEPIKNLHYSEELRKFYL